VTGNIGPEYRRLMDLIRSRITAGEYPLGKPIPSTTELKELTGMSIPVVRRAVGQLESDGILEGHPGKGVYVRAMPADADSERMDARTLSKHVTALQEQVRELTDRAASAQPADFGQELRELRETVGRIEVNLIDLYLKMGHDYPQGGSRDGAKAAARRGRTR
jgi:DNA-binding GntR family transcriptional regulator